MGKKIAKFPNYKVGDILQIEYSEGKKYFRVISKEENPLFYTMEEIPLYMYEYIAKRKQRRDNISQFLIVAFTPAFFIALDFATNQLSLFQLSGFLGIFAISETIAFWADLKNLRTRLNHWLDKKNLIQFDNLEDGK